MVPALPMKNKEAPRQETTIRESNRTVLVRWEAGDQEEEDNEGNDLLEINHKGGEKREIQKKSLKEPAQMTAM